ncbi:O-antigen ligase family protein [Candidatus Stoquefichus massiliensis]|uniref:O-antigen ligase family protein n=1 Tax=Candidatus Stoquefichus massiliensis TaxID=1470350 RepID=UPI000488C4E3|nr:O-antigen ligase family protein [Candidatus Stoquefichus massiliensis]
MMCFLIVSVITYVHLFFNEKKSFKEIIILMIVVIFGLIFFDDISMFFNNIFFHKWGNEDLTSGRSDIWKYTINNASLFGNGIYYLKDYAGITVSGLPFDAHNALLQILGCFGFFSFFVFCLLMFLILKKLLYRYNKKIIFVNFFVGWLSISMFENLELITTRMIPITFLFIFHLVMYIKK